LIDLDTFLSQLVVGLFRGSLYWILAAGLTLIFGVTRILNFAHAAILVTGSYITYTVYVSTGSYVLAFLGAIIACGLLGAATEVLLIRRVYGLDPLYQLLLTFGVTLVVNEAQKLVWGKGSVYVPTPEMLRGGVAVGAVTVSYYTVFVVIVGFLLLLALHYFINMTMMGLRLRAVWRDPVMSEVLGLNPKNYYTLVFFLGSAIAGLGGALLIPAITVGPGLGDHLIVLAFIVVVLAGLGNIVGSYIIALAIGVTWSLLTLVTPELDIVVLYLISALILMVRPQGLFGER